MHIPTFAEVQAAITDVVTRSGINRLKLARWNYPKAGTGLRQGARVERQVRRSLGDPFAASNRCLKAIAEREAKVSIRAAKPAVMIP